jgi:autotransporter-associated beta strand protein
MLSLFSLLFVALNVVKPVCALILNTVNGGKKSWKRRFPAGTLSERINSLLLAALFCAGGAAAQDGYWINSYGGSWASAGNWDPADGIAGGADNTAYFGFVREASITPNASFTLDGAQTIGNLCFTTQGGPGNWSFSPGVNGSLTLDSTFEPPEITVTSPSLQVTLNAVVVGGGGVEKDGAGTLVLAARNTYTGQTLVNGGGLNVTGSVGTGGVEVNNATLSGTGAIMGPVVIGSGGILSLGNTLGPLTINNSLVLLSGSTTIVTINAAAPGHAAVQGLSSVTFGGTLVVSNLSGALSLGQSFSIFGSAPASGNFSSIQPPPGPWLRWRFDPATGQITVVSSASQPVFSNVNMAGSNLVFQLTAGPPGSPCYIISSADLSQPKTAWTRIATNVFDMSGNCSSTNDFSANGAGQAFLSAFVIPSP